jgi:exodeoxyribonuclease III
MKRIILWNIRHGGGARVDGITDRLCSSHFDQIILTEFRNNSAGDQIKTRLKQAGFACQCTVETEKPRDNTVFLASRSELAEIDAPAPPALHRHRVITAVVDTIRIAAFYFPQDHAKAALFEYILELPEEFLTKPALLLGDFNTGKHYIDETGKTFYESHYLELIESRGWTDAWRNCHGDKREFSWYSHAGNGFRIDHMFASRALLPRIRQVDYMHQVREDCLSDHSAMILELS